MTEAPTAERPSTEAVMRARAVLRSEIGRLRSKAAIWGASGVILVSDANELESVRRHLLPMDYPSIIEAETVSNG